MSRQPWVTPRFAFSLSAPAALLLVPAALARPLERVPQDGDLQRAINRVDDRGVVEIADGVYPVPAGGFEIISPGKSFTIRAADGADVVLDGQGTERILLFSDEGAGLGRRVTFERLTFRNGFSNQLTRGGAVSLLGADAVFVSTNFVDNAYDGGNLGGGAVQLRDGSAARFTNCVFIGNSANLRGGAMHILESKVDVTWSQFLANRTNLPGHGNSAAGAILVLDGELNVVSSRFEGNEAGFVGGAINAFGIWREPLSEPATRVTVVNSTFIDNRTLPDPCCLVPGAIEVGGAFHVEDHVTLVIRNSRFEENTSQQGGALSSYRARMEVNDSVFRGNAARLPEEGPVAAGGTIVMTSSDFADSSTDFGAINRRNAELVMTNSFLQGRFGATGAAARQGGCLFASGDVNRMDGINGVMPDGSEADNRAPVLLRDVVFADCDVEGGGGIARGGAILAILADLTMEGSLVTDSDAFDDGATGGAVTALDRSALTLSDSTFARNSAGATGGAILVAGGEVDVRDSFFLGNDVTPGVAPGSPDEPIQNAPGAALALAPDNAGGHEITGVVRDSLFVSNVGLPIEDLDRAPPGPFNQVRYDGNRFQSTAFGAVVYKNPQVSFAGSTVPQLNDLVIDRGNFPPTDKSQRANLRLGNVPRTGRLVAAPPRVLRATAPGDPAPPTTSFLGYAWSGAGTANLADADLAAGSGFEEVTQAGVYRLRVGGQNVASAAVEQAGCSDGRLMCLRRERFLMEVDWRDFVGNSGNALAVPGVPADDSGLFFFFDENNWEILLKVLRGCNFNGHFWVFSAATTNVEYTLRVTDTVSGVTKSYFNPLGSAADAVTDTFALPVCDAMPAPGETLANETLALLGEELDAVLADPDVLARGRAAAGPVEPRKGSPSCTPDTSNLCLNDSRFRLEVTWRDFQGQTGSGEVVPFGTDDSGLFFFFNENNFEMLVKVLNGCNFNDHYWVFSAATTNVEYTLRVTDTDNGTVKQYFNPLGNAAPAVTDTGAFPTCP